MGPAAALGVLGTGREVGSALGQRSSLRTARTEPERVPLTLLECGRDRPPSKKEVTPHPSRQPQTAVMPHKSKLNTTNPQPGAFTEDCGAGSR